jgi:hypothetical protein
MVPMLWFFTYLSVITPSHLAITVFMLWFYCINFLKS